MGVGPTLLWPVQRPPVVSFEERESVGILQDPAVLSRQIEDMIARE